MSVPCSPPDGLRLVASLRTLIGLMFRYPARTTGVVIAITGALAPFVPAPVITAVLGVTAAVLGKSVHDMVTPWSTATAMVSEAAGQVARDLGRNTVGRVGEIGESGSAIVNGTVRQILAEHS